MQNLYDRAISAIEQNESFVQDVADNICQILDNVKHTTSFRVQIMFWLINHYEQYSHLREELKKECRQLF
jgi:hypothetical protein